ncbi:MAG: hypothetical protein ABIQ89_01230 [Candidatus Saccharimonadales bacterium]
MIQHYFVEHGHSEEALEASYGDPELADLYAAKEWLKGFPPAEMHGDTTEIWAEGVYHDIEAAIATREDAARQRFAAILDGESRNLSRQILNPTQPPQNR